MPIATDLDHPAAFVVVDDDTILFGERLSGRIVELDLMTGDSRPYAVIPDVVGELSNEQGLVGLALDPRDPDRLLAYATRLVGGSVRAQIVVVEASGDVSVLVDVMAAGERHNGGRLLFGPDGNLFVTVGETYDATLSQDLDLPAGKILRFAPDGAVPDDGPIEGSPIWAFGIRNSFGLAFDPGTGDLWETENGPECNDEINRVERGANLGWGSGAVCLEDRIESTNRDGPKPDQPEVWFAQTIGPTGIVFCDDCGLGTEREGRAFFGSFNTGEIHELTLSADRTRVRRDKIVFAHRNLVLSLERGPDGTLYFSDGIGIYRLQLAAV